MGNYPVCEQYKDSGVKWLGEIPKNWEVIKLRYTCEFLNRRRIPLSSEERGEMAIKEYPYYGASGIIDYVEDFIFNEETILIAEDGANLLSRSTPLAFIAKGKYWVNNHAHILRPLDGSFGYWANLLCIIEYDNWITGSAQPKLTKDNLASIKLPVPPLEEQKTIALFLDHKTRQIYALIAKQEALLEKLEEKRSALISHAVTKGLDPTVPMKGSGVEWLGEIPEHWQVVTLRLRYWIELGKMLDQRRISGEFLVRYLRNVDVQWDFINQEDLPEMDIPPDQYERYLVRDGDLLVCEGGEVGRSAIATNILSLLGYQKAIHRLRPLGIEEAPRYLFYLFFYLSNLGVFIAEGNPNTISHLTVEKLKLYRLPRPPKLEQENIIDYLDKATAEIDQQKARIQDAIALLKEYRTALITNAVTGKIDVRSIPVPSL